MALDALAVFFGLGAVTVALVTLYMTSLQAADIEVDHVEGPNTPVGWPGPPGDPHMAFWVEFDLLASNVGARAGVLDKVTVVVDPARRHSVWPSEPQVPGALTPRQPRWA